MFWISAAKTIPRQHTALPSSTIIGVHSCQKSIHPDQCVKQHLGREWQPPVPRLTTALLFLTLPPLLDLVGWSITLSGSVGCPGPAQVTSSQQLKCNCVASFFVPAENELIEFFEGVCIQSVHFTRDRCTFSICPTSVSIFTCNLIRDGRPSGDAYMVLASLK